MKDLHTLACRRYSLADSTSPAFLDSKAAILNCFCRVTKNSYSFSFLVAVTGAALAAVAATAAAGGLCGEAETGGVSCTKHNRNIAQRNDAEEKKWIPVSINPEIKYSKVKYKIYKKILHLLSTVPVTFGERLQHPE